MVGNETCMLLHFLAAVALQVLKLFVCVSVGNETCMLLHFLAMALQALKLRLKESEREAGEARKEAEQVCERVCVCV